MLEKVGGKDQAVEIMHMLLAKYPNKPAFRDEMFKLNYGA